MTPAALDSEVARGASTAGVLVAGRRRPCGVAVEHGDEEQIAAAIRLQ